jgi:hypothetical protein
MMIDQGKQDAWKEAQQLIAEAQAARVQAHVRAMLSRLPSAVAAHGEQQRAGVEQQLAGFARRGNCGRGHTT